MANCVLLENHDTHEEDLMTNLSAGVAAVFQVGSKSKRVGWRGVGGVSAWLIRGSN